jgi:hypothetical protein
LLYTSETRAAAAAAALLFQQLTTPEPCDSLRYEETAFIS